MRISGAGFVTLLTLLTSNVFAKEPNCVVILQPSERWSYGEPLPYLEPSDATRQKLASREDEFGEVVETAAYLGIDLIEAAPELENLHWIRSSSYLEAYFGHQKALENFISINMQGIVMQFSRSERTDQIFTKLRDLVKTHRISADIEKTSEYIRITDLKFEVRGTAEVIDEILRMLKGNDPW